MNILFPKQKQISENQEFKAKVCILIIESRLTQKNHYHPSEGDSYLMLIVDALTHYVALIPVLHCNTYYTYETLYKHLITKFGLPEILVTDNGTEIMNNK